MRLDKFLVVCGIGSRTEVKLLLKKKTVRVNDSVVTSGKTQVDETADTISYQGQVLGYEQFVYYMLNKPSGVISETEDKAHKTVLDLLDDTAKNKQVFPVGRLDRDTTGLLLMTNNGALAHAMLSPKKHVDKVYEAQIAGLMTQEDVEAFEAGIVLEDFTCQPAKLAIITSDSQKETCLVHITIREGKFHQVKRMVASRGKKVVQLKRLIMGPLKLDDKLALGAYRRLTEKELEALAAFDVSL